MNDGARLLYGFPYVRGLHISQDCQLSETTLQMTLKLRVAVWANHPNTGQHILNPYNQSVAEQKIDRQDVIGDTAELKIDSPLVDRAVFHDHSIALSV